MTTLSGFSGTGRGRPDRLALVLALLGLLLAPVGLLADKAVVPLVLVAALAGGVVAGAPALPWRVADRKLALVVGLLIAWCLLASLWSFHPLEAAGLALRVGLLLFVLLYLAGLAQRLGERQRRQVALAFCIGFGTTVLVIGAELAFDTPLFDLLHGEPASAYKDLSRLNRGVSAVAILVWPLAALTWQRRQYALALALPPALLGLTLVSQSSASMLALGAGLAAAAVASLGRGAARTILAAAVAAALLGSPLIAALLQQSGLAQADWLPDTGRYRLHVWAVVTDRIAERPTLGWGFDSSPDLPTADAEPFRAGEKVIPSHPHNGALQIMVETGIVGSLIVGAVLLLIVQRIDRLPPAQRSCAVAMFITTLAIACTAYGIWQSHWLAMIGAAAAVFIAVLPAPDP